MKTRAVQIATPRDLRRLDAAEQWAAELDEEAAAAETEAREPKAGSKPARKTAKTAHKFEATARHPREL